VVDGGLIGDGVITETGAAAAPVAFLILVEKKEHPSSWLICGFHYDSLFGQL